MLLALATLSLTLAHGLQLDLCRAAPQRASSSPLLSRKLLLHTGAAALLAGSQSAIAEEEEKFSKMGGLLEPFIDVQKGYKLYKPAGWTKVSL